MNLKLCASLVKMLQKPGTMWLVLFYDLCHSSLRMLSFLLCLGINVFWGSWTWYVTGPSPANYFCWESPLLWTWWWQKIGAKKADFSIVFSRCRIIWSDVMHVSSWVCKTTHLHYSTKFHCNRMEIGWDIGNVMYEAKWGQDVTLISVKPLTN